MLASKARSPTFSSLPISFSTSITVLNLPCKSQRRIADSGGAFAGISAVADEPEVFNRGAVGNAEGFKGVDALTDAAIALFEP